MPSKVAQQVIIGIVALVGFVLAVVTSPGHAAGALSATPLRLYSISVTVVGLAFIAYDRWLWRWPVVRRGRPRLAGTWRGTLTSNYVAPDGQAFTNLRIHLLIRQTFTTVTVTLLTDRSQSESGGSPRCAAPPTAGGTSRGPTPTSRDHPSEPSANPTAGPVS